MSTEAESGHERGLRRELRFWEAIALSIGIMAPGAAMALNGTLPASLVGRAVPLAFVFASVGILFVSYAFIRLTGYFNHAGSVYALAVIMVIAIVAFVSQRIGGVSAVNAFFYPGTIGVLSMLVAYIVTNVGALRFLFLSRRVRVWEAIVPVIALAILVYVIYANVYPIPDFPFNVFPYVVAAWLVLGLGIVLFVPGLARRIGANLAEREGLAIEESPRS